jgi:hypothetical protein
MMSAAPECLASSMELGLTNNCIRFNDLLS